ncbi:phosphatidylglycerophosphatase A [Desulfovibrio sp. OttesenSCG-928-C06]|nr:phosphatidylglycerophosphatase A [Desulfovibrio sp. OttesenSCG-928-C06]
MRKLDRLALAFSRVEPAGLSPWAPGTCGSAVAIVLAPFIFMPLPFVWRCVVLVALFIVGGIASTRAEELLGQKDPGCVVIDEVLGQWLACLPFAALGWWEYLLAFGLFRLFDISKPWPVKASEDWMKGGFGVMLDDAFAGLYAMLALGLARWLLAFIF